MDATSECDDELATSNEKYEAPSGIELGSAVELTKGAHGQFPDGNLFVYWMQG